jgi:hypothetical protein
LVKWTRRPGPSPRTGPPIAPPPPSPPPQLRP